MSLDNQLVSGNHTFTYSYYKTGNKLTMTVNGSELHTYTYDAENRLTSATTPTSNVTYQYDAFGRRIQKGITSDETRVTIYVYDGDQVICEYNESGNLVRKFLYGTGIDEVVRMTNIVKSANIVDISNRIDFEDLFILAEAWLSHAGPQYLDVDYNHDGFIGLEDLEELCNKWLETAGGTDFTDFAELGALWLTEPGTSFDPYYNADADLYADGRIDFRDFAVLGNKWLTTEIEEAIVNFSDFAVFAQSWMLETGEPSFNQGADLNSDNVVDLDDIKALAESWLTAGQGSQQYFYHYDGLGSVIALSNATGRMVENYHYDVYGKPNTTSTIDNPYYFTGRRYDVETGLYYYRARYYNSYIGRFLQVDPIGYEDGLNLYTYCRNNPLGFADPLGTSYKKYVQRFRERWAGIRLVGVVDSAYAYVYAKQAIKWSDEMALKQVPQVLIDKAENSTERLQLIIRREDIANALRHGMISALLYRNWKNHMDDAQQALFVHEKYGGDFGSLDSKIDLWNNEIGRQIGLGGGDIEQELLAALTQGRLVVSARDAIKWGIIKGKCKK